MPSTASLPVYTLNLHQGYRCRHSGVCCTAGWDIPIDALRLRRVSDGLATGAVVLPGRPAGPAGPAGVFIRGDTLPDDAAAMVGRTPSGACIFFDRSGDRQCAIQRGMGHVALPEACRHFPRVILLDDEGAHVAFSHVCPTAAGLLFRDDIGPLAVVADPAILSDPDEVAGFDARGTVPPFLRPGVVFDPESRRAWEAFAPAACSRGDEQPEQVLRCLATGADALRAWTPACGEMASYAAEVLPAVLVRNSRDAGPDLAGVKRLYAHVMRTVADGPARAGASVAEGVETLWQMYPAAWKAVNRYLGARAFGSWSAYRGDGVRTQVAVLSAALAVLTVEVCRRTVSGQRKMDQVLLCEAVGAADLLLVHESDDAALTAALGSVESQSFDAFTASLGLAATR